MNEQVIEAWAEINKDTLAEAGRYLIPPLIPGSLLILEVTFILLPFFFPVHSMFRVFFILFSTVFFYGIYLYCRAAIIRQNLHMMEVLLHVTKTTCLVRFQEEILSLKVIGGKVLEVKVPYTAISRIIETKHFYLMITKTGGKIIMDKTSLSHISKDEWQIFLSGKCTNVKKMR